MNLMKKGVLEGWCWQITETAILFLDDESYIERGNLIFSKYNLYYHSWIIFNYQSQDYVFDPCLQILCKKEIYQECFEPELKGTVTAKQVRKYFIDYVFNSFKKENYSKIENIMKTFFGENGSGEQTKKIVVPGEDNPNAPIYRNSVGYEATINDGNVKRLIAHYYINA
ncbi:MAG: hypothetical protein PHE54_00920 [Bacilli bacterium]|nr:hypothetical protein [Bacilli bacterium]